MNVSDDTEHMIIIHPKIEHNIIMNYVSQEGGPGVITTTQLFQSLRKEIVTPKMC